MGALPRPDLPPGPARDLNEAMHDQHHRAGWPSLRSLASEVGVSHTTVSHAFSSARLPTWGIVEVLVEAMHGDVTAFHDLWLAASAPSPHGTGPWPRIAGRRPELSVVRRHLEAGTGLLLVTGEAGMGKTKLVTTTRALIDTFVATGSCLPLSTAVPMLPIADALQRVFDVDDGQWFKEALTDAAPFVAGSIQRLVPDVELLLPTGTQPEDDWSRQRLFGAVVAILKRLGAARPLALLIEDLHWADTATLDLLEHLTTGGLAVPVVGTYRTADPSTPLATADWLGRVRRLPDTAVLALSPLTVEETTEQLSLLLGRRPAANLVTTVHSRSQGLPLFTEQLAGSADADEPLPELLADLLESRLVGLGHRAWGVARALGVADRPLPTTVVSAAGRLSGEEVIEGLRELDARLLLASTHERDVVQLRHPLLAEAIRRRLVPGEAAEQHRGLALALASETEPSAAEIATHWQRAGDLDEEVGWRVAAGRAAAERFAAAEEATQWLRVLELYSSGHVAPGGPGLSDVYFAGIDAAWSVGIREETDRLLPEAMATLADLDGKPRAELYFRAAARHMGRVGHAESLELLGVAIDTCRQLPPDPLLTLSLSRRAAVLRGLGRWDEAAADLDEAAELCVSLGDVSTLRWMRSEQAWAEAMQGNRHAALSRIDETSALTPEDPDPAVEIKLGVVLTDILLKCGGTVEEILAAAAPGLAAAKTWDVSIFAGGMLLSNVTEALIKAGDVAGAAHLIDPAAATPLLGDCWPIRNMKAQVDSLRGRLEDAATLASALVEEPGMTLDHRAETVPLLAAISLWRADPETALDLMLPLLDELAEADSSRFAGDRLVLAARAAADRVARGTTENRRQLVADLDTRLRQLREHMLVAPIGPGSVFADGIANERSWHAELARLDGSQTAEGWVRAATEWDKLTRPHDAAYCRWRAAQVALRDGQGSVAARLLKRAAKDAQEHVPLSGEILRLAGQ